jgi:hypothetical protein
MIEMLVTSVKWVAKFVSAAPLKFAFQQLSKTQSMGDFKKGEQTHSYGGGTFLASGVRKR